MMKFNSKGLTLSLILVFFAIFTHGAYAQNQGNIMLNQTQKLIVPIAAFTANGDIDKLKHSLNEGLDNGLTINEAKEAIVQAYAYAGFPRALNALTALMQVVAERKAVGKTDNIGKAASVISDKRPMVEIGTEIQTNVVGQPVTGALYEFSPEIDEFLKSHLFGDIFIRDVLDYKTREVVTITILATLTGVEAQLQGHFAIGMNVGLTKSQLQEIVTILNIKVRKDVAQRASETLAKMLK